MFSPRRKNLFGQLHIDMLMNDLSLHQSKGTRDENRIRNFGKTANTTFKLRVRLKAVSLPVTVLSRITRED